MRSRGQKVTIVPVAAAQPLMLYVANWSDSTVVGYPLGGPYGSPRVTLSTGVIEPQGLLFDRAGDLWVANSGSLDEYAKDQLTKRSPTPETVIQGSTSFATMAWDSSGDLWVDGYGDNTVDEYANSQLTRSGTPTPKVTLSGNDLSRPVGLTFDRDGDLWIGNEDNGQVLEYAKRQLTRSGSPTPRVDYIADGYAVEEDVVFDSSGNLWTSPGQPAVLVEYTKSQLTKPRASPAVSIKSLTLPAQDWPGGMTFDPSGNLWTTTWTGETVVEFTKAQLRNTGSPRPVVTIQIQDEGGPVADVIGP